MSRISNKPLRTLAFLTLTTVAASGLFAQDAPRSWRRVGDPPPNQAADRAVSNNAAPNDWQDQDGNAPQQNTAPPNTSYQQDNGGAPPRLTIRPGTYVTVRINQPISSDRNQPGDAFAASLARPLVVDGIVVAQT